MNDGRFKLAHKINEGRKSYGGRKPGKKTLLKRWERDNPLAVAELMQILYEAGLKEKEITCPNCKGSFIIEVLGDKEAAMYIIDRLRGKPPISIDQRIKGVMLNISGDDFAKISQLATAQEQKLLTEVIDV